MKIFRTGENPKISLVYVNFRSVRPLRKSLESVWRNRELRKNIEIVVANNDHSESWALRALKRRFPIRIIDLPGNLGFGHAANEAVSIVRSPYVGFLNPDTEFFSGNIADIPKIFEKYHDIGVLGARLLSHTGESEPWSSGRAVSLWQIFRNNMGIPSGKALWESRKPVRAGFVSGAALFTRSELFRKLQGFDERFFLYFEDADLCLRVWESGYRVFLFPKLTFFHEGGVSHATERSKKEAFYDSQERYFRKNRPIWESWILSIMKKILL